MIRTPSADPSVRATDVFRIDLLLPERSSGRHALIALLSAPAVRSALLLPAIVVLVMVGILIVEQLRISSLDGSVAKQRETYRALVRDAQQAQLRVQSYDQLRTVAKHFFGLRRSVVQRAQEIVAIGNIVVNHHLALSNLSDTLPNGDGQGAGYWELRGQTANTDARRRTCFTNVAATLPDFLRVPNVTAAMPSNQRNQRSDAKLCDYTIRLTRALEQ
jgi:hypothetical protein